MAYLILCKTTGTGTLVAAPQTIRTLGASSNDVLRDVGHDTAGNVYVTGYSNASGTWDAVVAKYDVTNTLEWQLLVGMPQDVQSYGAEVDGDGNVYLSTHISTSPSKAAIIKIDNTGTIVWQRELNQSVSSSVYLNNVTVKNTDVVVTGVFDFGTGTGMFIAKYNTSGVIQWQNGLRDSVHHYGRDVAVDSVGNSYVAGEASTATLSKYNSSGTLEWQRMYGSAGQAYKWNGISIDNNDNIYVVGVGNFNSQIAKYNTSGVIQWQRTITGNSSDMLYRVSTDATGNVYALGYSESGPVPRYMHILKYAPSGTLTWQRALGAATGLTTGYGISVNLDSIHVGAYTQSAGEGLNDMLYATVPTDGSGTGTFTPFTYGVVPSTITSTDESVTEVAGTLTEVTPSVTDDAGTFTSVAAPLIDTGY